MKKFKRLQVNPIQALVRATLLTSCLSMANIALAENSPLPYTPGFTLMGLTGDLTTGYADVMVPLFGQPTSFFYLDPQGLIQNENYTASLGGGFRHLSESAGILGAYVFGDYNQSSNGNGFWFVSPGVERLGKTVDFGANLYIPTSTQRKDVSSTTGLEMGTYDYITFQEHSEYDGLFQTFESVGVGADAEVGVRIPMMGNNPKLYVGGYYFNPEDANDNITGVTARLEVPLTDQLTFLVSDGYDNVENNTFKLGFSYNFGGRKNSKSFKGDLTERMVDPIHRNLIAVSGGSKTGEPIVQTVNQSKVLIKDDIAFFNAAESMNGDGTYENPFNHMDQANINTALNGGNNNFYINSGDYDMGGGSYLLTDTNFYGRQSYNGNPFVQSAVGDNRPLFEFDIGLNQPGFLLAGSQLSFDSVRVQGTGLGSGIAMSNLGDKVLSINNTEVTNFGSALDIRNFNHLDLQIIDSNFDNNSADGFFLIDLGDGETDINVLRSSFNNNTNYGLEFITENNNRVTFIDSSFNQNGTGMSFINLSGNTELNVINSSVNQNNSNGMFFVNVGNAEINVVNSSFNQNALTGIQVQNLASMTLFDLNVTDSSFNQNAIGIDFLNTGTDSHINLVMADSTFNQNNDGLQLINNVETSDFNVDIIGSAFTDNADTGFFAQTLGANTDMDITVMNSDFSRNLTGIFLENTGTSLNMQATNSVFADNTNYGVFGQNFGSLEDMTVTLINPEFSGNGADTNKDEITGNNVVWNITP